MTETVIDSFEGYHFEVPNAAIMAAANIHCPLFHRSHEEDPPCLTCIAEVRDVAPAIAKGAALAFSHLIEPKEPLPHLDKAKRYWLLGRRGAARDIRLIAAGQSW